MFPRKIYPELKKQAQDRKISLLLGARQVGKTTLLRELHQELSKTHKCLFLDLDILEDYEDISTFENLVAALKQKGYLENQKDFFYLFIDEVQIFPLASKIMKNVYDHLENVKIYASGSSSLAVKNQVQESLAGRKHISEIFPLDFEEFLWFKQKKELSANLLNLVRLEGNSLHVTLHNYHRLLTEFLIFGGYPGVVLKQTNEDKIKALSSIFDLYVKKDLVEYLNITKILETKRLIEFLAVNNGQKIKLEEISKLTSFSFVEIKRYLEVLEETYLIKTLRPFYTNKNKEMVKTPKIYFIDNGVRNFFINNFNELNLRTDAGFLFEGFIISELLKQEFKDPHFWQDKNGLEVDLILNQNANMIAIEIKFKTELKSEDFKGIEFFLKEYPQTKKRYLVNLSQQKFSPEINLILPYALPLIKFGE